MSEPPGAVFDTGVVLQAGLRPTGPAGRLLSLVDQRLFTLHVSDAGLVEYRDVLSRPSIRAKNPHLSTELVSALIERIRQHAVLTIAVPEHFHYSRDPDDEHVLNLAIEAGVRYLVSRDNDLLDLMDESRQESRDFRQRFPKLVILDPPAFLRELTRGEQGNQPPTPG